MNRSQQAGYFLIIAIIFIMVIGLMGTIIVHLFANRAQLSVAQQSGLSAFYMAESGYEIGTRLLTMPTISGTPTRLACASVTGNGANTNAALASGTFTLTTINSSPIFANNTLSGAITTSSTTIPLTSASGFAASGRVIIDLEAIDYAAISGNSLIGVTRGAASTAASSHTSGTRVGQYQCSLDSQAFIPNAATSTYKRELQWNVQLQEGWLVGNNSGSNFVFAHWNRPTELSWTSANLAGGGSATDLNAVSMLSNVDGWAVGFVVGSNFTFLRWNGSAWQLSALAGACGTQDLFGVSMVSSQQGWAVGGRYRPSCVSSGNFRYTVMRWNGSAWAALSSSTIPAIPADASGNQNLNAVHVIDNNGDGLGNVGFAVGDSGTMLYYNGTVWASVASSSTRDLRAVFTVSSSEAWAVGTSGAILRWNGSSWSTVSPSPTSVALNGIAMLDTNGDGAADIGWAVGNSGVILTYNGSNWSLATDLGSTNIFSVAIVNTNDAWATGNGGSVYHWYGSSWDTVDIGVSQALNGVSFVPNAGKPVSGWQQIFR